MIGQPDRTAEAPPQFPEDVQPHLLQRRPHSQREVAVRHPNNPAIAAGHICLSKPRDILAGEGAVHVAELNEKLSRLTTEREEVRTRIERLVKSLEEPAPID